MSRFKITVKVPVGHGSSVKRMMSIEVLASTLFEALSVARGQYGIDNVFGGVKV